MLCSDYPKKDTEVDQWVDKIIGGRAQLIAEAIGARIATC